MAIARQRLLTLCYEEMETIRMELEAVARDWTKPPPDAIFGMRVPVEYASIHAARLVSGPYIYLTGEDSYQIAISGVQGIRVEIVSDAPPPPEEPPPPPVIEMPATFNLELAPNMTVALDTTVSSAEDLDMARMEDGTMVDGQFWGKLDVVHNGDVHKMEFSGTRIANPDLNPEVLFDSRALTKLSCHLSILAPAQQYCDVILTFSPLWKIGTTWPPAEKLEEGKMKYFVRVHPGGALEHFESEMVVTALYYEAVPDQTMVDPSDFIAPRNGFAMSYMDFIPHLMNVLDQLGMSIHARTTFINGGHDISVTADNCVFTRLFLIFRGLSDDDMGNFAGAGEKEANQMNWREVVGWNEESKDSTMFRVLETTVLEVS
ncbi:hypothetical protein BD626DRAFT_548391 [Schizophyllum amplum]|uniref:Uncharacterized protein n=1 Tax=Schizophyllum amplum TaxID=97359 RepID=A0A550CCC7_9AGAR|nr:hypothetical protein BD626DRAFT_548391 [Auriculariopsis ampla]